MPARKASMFIRAVWKAVVAQDYDGHLRVLVVDKESGDDTPQVTYAVAVAARGVARFDRPHNPTLTAPTARNLGLREARADLIGRLGDHGHALSGRSRGLDSRAKCARRSEGTSTVA